MTDIQVVGKFAGYNLNDLTRKTLNLLYMSVTKDTNGLVTGDFSRYSQADITEALNEAIEDITLESRMLKTFAMIRLREDQREYLLPQDLFSLTQAWYFDSAGTPRDLEIYPYLYAVHVRPYILTMKATPPEFIYKGDAFGNTGKFGVYPIPGTDGDAITFSSSLGAVTGSTLGTITGDLTGAHAGPDSSASLIATGVNFVTAGVVVGMMVFNNTDGSKGQVTAINTTSTANDTLAMTLAGGSDNDWDTGDSYQIGVGEYGEIMQIDGTETYIFSSTLGGITSLTPSANNLMIEYYRYPARFSDLSHYTEVERYFQKALPFKAAAELLTSEASRSDYQAKVQAYEAKFQYYVARATMFMAHTKVRHRNVIRPLR
jgi:hypothetical protein